MDIKNEGATGKVFGTFQVLHFKMRKLTENELTSPYEMYIYIIIIIIIKYIFLYYIYIYNIYITKKKSVDPCLIFLFAF